MSDERKAWESILSDIHGRNFPFDPIANGEVKKAVFEQLHVAFWKVIPDYPAIGENAKMRLFELPDAVNEIVFQVNSWILDGHKVDRLVPTEIEFPATVWDHWKMKHAPEWFIRRWPVKYTKLVVTKEIHQHYVCPHINAKEDRHPHIEWMHRQSGQDK